MSGYEDSPQAQLGIGCLICGRPLAAADSLALHMGPICRKRVGAPELSLDADQLHEANRLTGEIAREGATAERLEMLRAVAPELDCLADRLALIRAPVSVWDRGAGVYEVRFGYSARVVEGMKRIPGRRFFPHNKDAGELAYWTVPNAQRGALWAWMREHFAGQPVAVTMAQDGPRLHEIPHNE